MGQQKLIFRAVYKQFLVNAAQIPEEKKISEIKKSEKKFLKNFC